MQNCVHFFFENVINKITEASLLPTLSTLNISATHDITRNSQYFNDCDIDTYVQIYFIFYIMELYKVADHLLVF
mgnify:CR=1 FL=1